MTETEIRNKVVSIMRDWIGMKEPNHKPIIDIYNAHKPLARGYRVRYTDPWCATTVSAAMIQAGLTDIAPTECSCSRMIELYRKIGRWKEDDKYLPKPGDLVMYDWDDNGVGENRGAPEHVGVVEQVNGSFIIVIEGNKNNAVERRTIPVNGRYIRGWCLPDYASKAAQEAPGSPREVIKRKAGLSDATLDYLEAYRFGEELLQKLEKAMR